MRLKKASWFKADGLSEMPFSTRPAFRKLGLGVQGFGLGFRV